MGAKDMDLLRALPYALPSTASSLWLPSCPIEEEEPCQAVSGTLSAPQREAVDARMSSGCAGKLYLESGQGGRLAPPSTHWAATGKSLGPSEVNCLHR